MILTDQLQIRNWNGYPVITLLLQWTGGSNYTVNLDRSSMYDVDLTTLERIAKEFPEFIEKFKCQVKTLGGNL